MNKRLTEMDRILGNFGELTPEEEADLKVFCDFWNKRMAETFRVPPRILNLIQANSEKARPAP